MNNLLKHGIIFICLLFDIIIIDKIDYYQLYLESQYINLDGKN